MTTKARRNQAKKARASVATDRARHEAEKKDAAKNEARVSEIRQLRPDASQSELRAHLLDIVRKMDTAMVVTRGGDGLLRSRPMGIAKVEDDAKLLFTTQLESGKVHDVEQHPQMNVAMSAPTGMQYASLSGKGRVFRDEKLAKDVWTPLMKMWFSGPDDPSIAFIELDPAEGEYWDNKGVNALKFAFDAARAILTGKDAPHRAEENARVAL